VPADQPGLNTRTAADLRAQDRQGLRAGDDRTANAAIVRSVIERPTGPRLHRADEGVGPPIALAELKAPQCGPLQG